jgi:hypothetical protein
MRASGGPLPFPSDGGRQLSCKSCLPRFSRRRWTTRALPRKPLRLIVRLSGSTPSAQIRDTSPPRDRQARCAICGEHVSSGWARRNLRSHRRAPAGRLSNATQTRINPGQPQPHWSAGVRRLSKRDCSGRFRLERLAGWALHPLESAAFSRRTREPDIADRGGGGRIWADSAPTGVASGRTGVRA